MVAQEQMSFSAFRLGLELSQIAFGYFLNLRLSFGQLAVSWLLMSFSAFRLGLRSPALLCSSLLQEAVSYVSEQSVYLRPCF